MYYKLINAFVEDVQFVDGVGDFRLLSQRAVCAIAELQENNRFQKDYLLGLVIIQKSFHIKCRTKRDNQSGILESYLIMVLMV